ncbi:expressed unknown protein [Seminavis robusta]|uniref:Uncharacterized protein n=1 Tax=Seminavis robusta TaxID=568900 RepID=A0A9N8E5M8_9STRA|nr:expressed unknown protein [Seminavis robusta]|eukprot:Sro566_g167870.1 n/a (282) ;mRNA; r:48708-49553
MKLSSAFATAFLTLYCVQAFPTSNFMQPRPSFVTTLQQTSPLRASSSGDESSSVVEEGPKQGWFGRIFRRNRKLEKQIKDKSEEINAIAKAKAEEIKAKATDRLVTLEENLEQAIQKETDEIINRIALDVLTLVGGHWDVSVITSNQKDTKDIMEGRVNDLANELVEMGATTGGEGDIKEALRNSRLKIKQTFDGSDSPLRVQQEVFLGARRVIQVFGKLQFDLLEHKALYALDELVVLGTAVDLDKIVVVTTATEAQEEEQATEVVVEPENDDEAAKEES